MIINVIIVRGERVITPDVNNNSKRPPVAHLTVHH